MEHTATQHDTGIGLENARIGSVLFTETAFQADSSDKSKSLSLEHTGYTLLWSVIHLTDSALLRDLVITAGAGGDYPIFLRNLNTYL